MSAAGRGRAKVTGVSMRTRPGRSVSTRTRSARSTASSTLCVTITVVGRLSSQMRSSSKFILRRVTASRAPKGSSSSSSLGFRARARAIATRWRMPPESSPGRACSKPSRPTSAISSLMRSFDGCEAGDFKGKTQVAFHRSPGQQGMLLEGDAQRVLGLQLAGRLAVDLDLACGWLVESGQQMQHGALAAAGGTDEGHEFAIRYLYIDRDRGPRTTACRAIRSGAGRIASHRVRQASPWLADRPHRSGS